MLGILKSKQMKSPGERFSFEEEAGRVERTPETDKSSNVQEFLNKPKTRSFIERWANKKRGGKKAFTKRGVVSLLSALFRIPGFGSDEEVLESGEDLLSQLGGMDGLQGFLLGWKAKSEGLMRAVKTFVGQE
jgi:hypothetical protein